MGPMTGMARSWAVVAFAAPFWNLVAVGTPTIPLKYCANVNTGSSTAGNNSIFQSDGLCHDFCHDRGESLAILQGNTCWCSNTAPDSSAQENIGSCQEPCQGYPDDICGGNGGLFAYLDTGAGGSSGSSSSASQSAATTPAPTPTVQTVTESGTVWTVTVTPTSGVSSSDQTAMTNQGGNGLGAGAAAGIAVAVVAIVAAAAIAAFCVWRRKKKREDPALLNSPSPRGSSSGMMSSTKAAEAGASPSYVGRGGGGDGSWDRDTDQSGRRRSMLMPIDPRIDPAHSGIYNRNDNISHDSVNSLRDDQDYSRRVHQPKVLRAVNPDPEDD